MGSITDGTADCYIYFAYVELTTYLFCLVKSKPYKQEVSRAVIIPLTKWMSILLSNRVPYRILTGIELDASSVAF